MIPASEPVLTADSTWIDARNADGVKLMTRRGNAASAVVGPPRTRMVYRVTLSDGSWFRTTMDGIKIRDGGEPTELPTLDTNHGGAKPGPTLAVKSIGELGELSCVSIGVPPVDNSGYETGGMIVVRNYVVLDAR